MEELKALLNLILIAAIPVCAAFFVRFINRKTEQIKAQTDSDAAKAALDEISLAVSAAVSFISQTYVDAFKEAGTFKPEVQQLAMRKCIYAVRSILSPAVSQYIREHVSNLDDFLIPLIEAEVRKQKQQQMELVSPMIELETTASLSEEDVMDLARKTISEAVNDVADDLADKLSRVFESAPVTLENPQQTAPSKGAENPANFGAEIAGV